jgi:Ca2+-binding EF-hand superfamily protein
MFNFMDSNNKGYLSPKDLRLAFLKFGFEISKQKVYKIISDIQKSGFACVNKETFVAVVMGYNKPSSRDSI